MKTQIRKTRTDTDREHDTSKQMTNNPETKMENNCPLLGLRKRPVWLTEHEGRAGKRGMIQYPHLSSDMTCVVDNFLEGKTGRS